MLKRLLIASAFAIASLPALAQSNVNGLTASGAIVGTQQLYCPTTAAGSDLKCTFTQVDAFINAQFSGAFTVGGTGVATLAAVPISTGISGLGTGVATALGVNVGTAGSPVVNGGALGTPSSGTLTNVTGLPISTGVSGLGTGVATAAAANTNSAAGLATAAAPLTAGGSGSLTGAFGYYICTGVCTVTLPTPAAGFQFCVRNDNAITSVITIAAISGVQFEKTTYATYGTVTTGTMVSGGAAGDKICLVGRDATHYLVGSFVGTWTNS